MEVTRGSTSTRKLKLSIGSVDNLPAEFKAVFTVKRVRDSDITDSKAIIQKEFIFPTDFTDETTHWETDLVLTSEDTTQDIGDYFWNVRFIANSDTFISDSTEGTFKIKISTTQRQTA